MPDIVVNDFIKAKSHITENQQLPMIVIYFNTKDYPGKYIARLWRSLANPGPTEYIALTDTLEDIRQLIPPGMVCLSRDDEDDPVIVETWI